MLFLLTIFTVLIFAGVGWLRGAIKFAAAFVALIVAGILAKPLYPLTGWMLLMGGVPKLLIPPLGTITTGMLLFVLTALPLSWWISKKHGEKQPTWNKPLGSALGGVWGLFITMFTLVGFTTVARVDRAVRQGNAEAELRAEARTKFARRAQAELGSLASTMSKKQFQREKEAFIAQEFEEFHIQPTELKERMDPSGYDDLLIELKHSPFESFVDSVSPFDQRAERILNDLAIVVRDPTLFAKFKRHPVVKDLMKEPKMKELSRDPELSKAIKERRFRDVLDHPKLISAIKDTTVRKKFSDVDIGAILREVRTGKKPKSK